MRYNFGPNFSLINYCRLRNLFTSQKNQKTIGNLKN